MGGTLKQVAKLNQWQKTNKYQNLGPLWAWSSGQMALLVSPLIGPVTLTSQHISHHRIPYCVFPLARVRIGPLRARVMTGYGLECTCWDVVGVCVQVWAWAWWPRAPSWCSTAARCWPGPSATSSTACRRSCLGPTAPTTTPAAGRWPSQQANLLTFSTSPVTTTSCKCSRVGVRDGERGEEEGKVGGRERWRKR